MPEVDYMPEAYSPRCSNDGPITFMGVGLGVVSGVVTLTGDTIRDDTLRGFSFMIVGVLIDGIYEPEETSCLDLIDTIAGSFIIGGGLGLIASWVSHVIRIIPPTTPKYVPSPSTPLKHLLRWQSRYRVPSWDLNLYRRGLRLTYRF